jgi:hypothetical protein
MQMPADSKEVEVAPRETPDVPEPLPEGAEAAMSPAELRNLLRVGGSQKNAAEGASKQVQEALQHGPKLWDIVLEGAIDPSNFKRAPTYDPERAT